MYPVSRKNNKYERAKINFFLNSGHAGMMIRVRVLKHRRNKRTDGDVETYGRMRRFEELKKTVQLSFQSRRLMGAS